MFPIFHKTKRAIKQKIKFLNSIQKSSTINSIFKNLTAWNTIGRSTLSFTFAELDRKTTKRCRHIRNDVLVSKNDIIHYLCKIFQRKKNYEVIKNRIMGVGT